MVSSMHTAERIAIKLEQALAPLSVQVQDDSAKHRGHAGASGGGHFSVRIVAGAFEGLALVARHRLVYGALADEMSGAVHALALETLTPAEAESSR